MSAVPQIRFERRLNGLFWVFVAAFALLTLRLGQLQIARSETIRAEIRESRTVLEPIPAARGDILDRHGRHLARTTATYSLFVYPSKFRETTRVYALADLAAAWLPRSARGGTGGSRDGRRVRAEHAASGWSDAWERRRTLVASLLALPVDSLEWDALRLEERLASHLFPVGELILPPRRLGARLRQALLALADPERVPHARALRRRLTEARTVGEALGTDAPACVARIEAEVESLRWLATSSRLESVDELVVEIAGMGVREARRIERRLDEIVDDQIAVDRLGTCDLERIDPDDYAELVRDVRVAVEDPVAVTEAIERLAASSTDVAEAAETLATVRALLAGRRPSGLEDYELRSVARLLELWDDDPAAVKRAFARRERARDDFDIGEFLSTKKEWERRLRYKWWYTYEVARGCTFGVADRVWSPFGLRRLGFDVVAGHGREYWRDAEGVATYLVGRLNTSGRGLAGLEATLERGDPAWGEETSILGEPGVAEKIKETDGRLRELGVRRASRAGAQVRLTIDRELQAEIEEILIELVAVEGGPDNPSTGGGACIIDIATGDVLVLASAPRLGGPDFIGAWEELERARREHNAARRAHRTGDVSDRAREAAHRRFETIRRAARYRDRGVEAWTKYTPPGSVMKCFAAIAALNDGKILADATHDCGAPKYHGTVDLRGAIEVSCNQLFWKLATEVRRDWLVGWYRRFGLFEAVPFLMNAPTGARRAREVAKDGVKNLIIGQQSLTTSPLELAGMWANVGRYGRAIAPRIVLSADGVEVPARELGEVGVSRQAIDYVLEAMNGVTRRLARKDVRLQAFADLKIAGKTGTAEGYVGPEEEENISWFAGVAPYDAPRLAFAVFCEHTHAQGQNVAPYAAWMVNVAMERLGR